MREQHQAGRHVSADVRRPERREVPQCQRQRQSPSRMEVARLRLQHQRPFGGLGDNVRKIAHILKEGS